MSLTLGKALRMGCAVCMKPRGPGRMLWQWSAWGPDFVNLSLHLLYLGEPAHMLVPW